MDARYSVLKEIEIEGDVLRHFHNDDYYKDVKLSKQIIFKFTKGVVEGVLFDGGPVFYFPYIESKRDFFTEIPSCIKEIDNYRLVEESVRKFLVELKELSCYEDCGSVGLCETCERYYKGNVPHWMKVIDRYHKQGELREATDEELKNIIYTVWMYNYNCVNMWDNIPFYMLEQGIKASDERIQRAKENFISIRR